MASRRWFSLLRTFLIGVLAAVPLACAQVVASKAELVVASANAVCPVGSEGCPCTAGGGCDPGLYCDGGICVGGGMAGEAEYEYDFADDFAPTAPPPEPEPIMMERSVSKPVMGGAGKARRRSRRSGRLGKKAANSETYAAEAPADYAAESSDGAAPQPEPSDTPRDPADEVDHGRQVIYTATLHVSVYDRDATMEIAENLPQRYGGWIESRYDYQITLRIRAVHLFDAMADLAELGVVLDKTLLAEDVTAEYVDLEARIRILEEMVRQLEALLAKAISVEQALEIRAALDRIRIELEAARARMRQLSEMIDFSTLTLLLSPRGPNDELPSSNDPFPWVDVLGVESTEYR